MTLYKPVVGETVPASTFVYLRGRAKQHAYNVAIKEFKKSGISKAELGRRLGKRPDRVSRILGGPGNWTIATLSDLLFAISGGVPTYGIHVPPQPSKAPPQDLPEAEFDNEFFVAIALLADTPMTCETPGVHHDTLTDDLIGLARKWVAREQLSGRFTRMLEA